MITAEAFAGRSTMWREITPSLDQYVRWLNQNTPRFGLGVRQSPETRPDVAAILGAHWASSPEMSQGELSASASSQTSLRPGPSELFEARLLAEEILRYPFMEDGASVSWEHRLAGCGEVEACYVDLLIGSAHIVEIKAVNRAFRGLDIRQLLTYAAISESLSSPVGHLGLLNPRLGTYMTWDVGQLALDLGSPSYMEMMAALQMQMSSSLVSD